MAGENAQDVHRDASEGQVTFEWYEGGGRGRYSFPSCSLSKSGSMTFAPRAVSALGNPDAVRLGWDGKQRRIGVVAAEKGSRGALTMRVSKDSRGNDSGSRIIFAKSFLTHFGILPTSNDRFRLHEAGDAVFALNVDDPLPRSRSDARGPD